MLVLQWLASSLQFKLQQIWAPAGLPQHPHLRLIRSYRGREPEGNLGIWRDAEGVCAVRPGWRRQVGCRAAFKQARLVEVWRGAFLQQHPQVHSHKHRAHCTLLAVLCNAAFVARLGPSTTALVWWCSAGGEQSTTHRCNVTDPAWLRLCPRLSQN